MTWEHDVPGRFRKLYEVHEFHQAPAILSKDFPEEFAELCEALGKFRFTKEDVKVPGRSETSIPKRFSGLLRPLGWKEEEFTARVIVDDREFGRASHEVEFLKNRVAFELDWYRAFRP